MMILPIIPGARFRLFIGVLYSEKMDGIIVFSICFLF